MREIKFRYTYQHEETGILMYKYYTINDIEKGEHIKGLVFRYFLISKDQYTGLKDKNDKEIYEGDILEIDHAEEYDLFDNKLFIVKWDIENAMFYLEDKEDKEAFWDFRCFGDNIEVIGNIYENPKLLEN
jgi:uncharacterized phage protein (TIGR01671 family)